MTFYHWRFVQHVIRLTAACKHEWKRLILTHLADTVNRCRVRGRLKRSTEVAPTKLSKWKPRSVAFSLHREGGVSTFSTFPCARIVEMTRSIHFSRVLFRRTWISSSFECIWSTRRWNEGFQWGNSLTFRPRWLGQLWSPCNQTHAIRWLLKCSPIQ